VRRSYSVQRQCRFLRPCTCSYTIGNKWSKYFDERPHHTEGRVLLQSDYPHSLHIVVAACRWFNNIRQVAPRNVHSASNIWCPGWPTRVCPSNGNSFDRVSRFSSAHDRVQQTDWPTETTVSIGRETALPAYWEWWRRRSWADRTPLPVRRSPWWRHPPTTTTRQRDAIRRRACSTGSRWTWVGRWRCLDETLPAATLCSLPVPAVTQHATSHNHLYILYISAHFSTTTVLE